MKSFHPFAIYSYLQWIEASGLEPQVTIVNGDKVGFPSHLKDQQHVTFKVTSSAVINFVLDEEGISFKSKFGGVPMQVYAPLTSIVLISSSNGEIKIPVKIEDEKTDTGEKPEPEEIKKVEPQTENTSMENSPSNQLATKEKSTLKLIQGGGAGNKIPSGKLKLVK
jgi:stringent starvation protein B